jgi:hypothetical protein
MGEEKIKSGNGGGIIVNDAGGLLEGHRTTADSNLTIKSTVSLDGLTKEPRVQLVNVDHLNSFKVEDIQVPPATVADFGVECGKQPDQLTVTFDKVSFSLSVTRKMKKITGVMPYEYVYVLEDSGPVTSVHVSRKQSAVGSIDGGDAAVEFHGKF